jgi:ABC-type glycerol-3-phosphate transport system substrate-binding protein
MKQKLGTILFFTALGIVGAFIVFSIFFRTNRFDRQISEQERLSAYILLLEDLPEQSNDYIEYLRSSASDDYNSSEPKEIVLFENLQGFIFQDEKRGFPVDIEETGLYELHFRYRRLDDELGNYVIGIQIDGSTPFNEAIALELPRLWMDETKEFGRDRYNDQTLPVQLPYEGWMESALFDSSGQGVDPLLFNLTSGRHYLEFFPSNTGVLEVSSIVLKKKLDRPSYAEYLAQFSDKSQVSEAVSVEINAVQYSYKNAYDVRMASYKNPAMDPFDQVDRLLNVIDGQSWDQAGEEIIYEVEIPESGFYTLSLHYNNPQNDFSVFRSIRINGEIPFQELESYEFPANGASRWMQKSLSSSLGDPFYLYLEKGKHQLSLKAEKEPVNTAARSLKTIIAHMNFFGIEIIKVAGKEVDKFRTWRLTDYLPKSAAYLDAYQVLIADIIEELAAYSTRGLDSSVTASLYTALFKLEKLAEDPDELPVYLSDIYSTSIYDRPITQILGDVITLLEESELSMNAFYLDTEPVKRHANANIFSMSWTGIRSLLSTFTSEKFVTRNEEGVLNIWVTRPITHTDIMQKLADSDFTTKTGIEVKISVMPDPNRLILATAAGRTPDIAMGLPSYIPFDLAIRGAALDMSRFEDFWEFASEFSPGAFIPYVLNEDVYAMPETLDFHTLVYRTDIFNQLELEPPDTWDEVVELLPVLQRYGMNFYHPIAGGLPTLKWFYQTSPFVYQFGGTLYGEDGLSVSLDNPKTVQGLRYLTELFNLYALQEQVPIFYNSFRFGITPVGIVDSQSYLQMKYAAPELKGQWALAPYPGIPNEEGEPQRWFIANGVAALIMKDTELADESWEFVKWWLSEKTQSDFGYRLQATYGPEFLWVSANLKALESSPIDTQDKEVILEQVRWQRDVPRTPAQYMLERGLSDIWIRSATQNRSVRTEIDKMIPVIDREVSRKMTEFGYLDEQGRVLKPFRVPRIEWILDQISPYLEVEGEVDE